MPTTTMSDTGDVPRRPKRASTLASSSPPRTPVSIAAVAASAATRPTTSRPVASPGVTALRSAARACGSGDAAKMAPRRAVAQRGRHGLDEPAALAAVAVGDRLDDPALVRE